MKTFFITCLAASLLLLNSCTQPPLPLPTENLVGIWRGYGFQMGASDVEAYLSLAFYDNQQFSFKLNLPVGGDDVRPFKWGGDWSVDRAGELQLIYEGESGFMGTFSQTSELFEKFNFILRDNRLVMDSELFGIDFILNLQRVE